MSERNRRPREQKYQETDQEALEQAADEEHLEEAAAEAIESDGPQTVDQARDARAAKELTEMTAYAGEVGDGVSYRILPQVTRSGARWVAIFYLAGAQGPVAQVRTLSQAQAADLGVSEAERERINALVRRANRELSVPKSLRGQARETRPVSSLENTLE